MFRTQPKNCRRFFAVVIMMGAISLNAVAQTQKNEAATAPVTGTITGRVLNENGQALANAAVSIRGAQPFFQPRTTTTDNDGNFEVTGLDPVLYGVTAYAPSYVTPPRDPDSPPNYYRVGETVTVNLIKGGVITGSVTSPTGDPVVQIAVRAILVRDANGQQPRYAAFQIQRATDDRGIYRIYGLLPGTYVVVCSGRGAFNSFFDAYETDAPTYAPSSPRDTAAEITVRSGEETSGVDIRYRGEPGHTISGFVSGALDQSTTIPSNVTMLQISNGAPMGGVFAFQPPANKGFAFYGVADGEYDLVAQSSVGPGETSISEPKRITVRGADVSGLELFVKTLGSINGRVALEKSEAIECKNKRQPLFAETLVVARRNEKETPKEQPRLFSYFVAQGSPTKTGDFQLRNMGPGNYNLATRFFARYWYLRSITRELPSAAPTPTNKQTMKRIIDVARDGLSMKFGERHRDVVFTLTEGAASVRGTIKPAPGVSIPPKLYVHLVPAEKENAEDVLRFFADEVLADGSFGLNNVPPGHYWLVARLAATDESSLETKIRMPGETQLRSQVRRAAEAATTEIELKPCQNLSDYSLSYR